MTQKTLTKEHGPLLLDAAVRALFEVSWGQARKWIERGKITVDGEPWTDPLKRVMPGASLVLTMNAQKPRPATDLPKGAIVYVDPHDGGLHVGARPERRRVEPRRNHRRAVKQHTDRQ